MAIVRVPFQIPGLIEVQLYATEIGLPEREATKFWFYHDSKGWKIGNKPMKRWKSALQTWKFNWEDRGGTIDVKVRELEKKLTPMDKQIFHAEFLRCQEKLKRIKDTYGGAQKWTDGDRKAFQITMERRDELKKMLGIKI